MSVFIQLHSVANKSDMLASTALSLRSGDGPAEVFDLDPEGFSALPGAPFAYWASQSSLGAFSKFPPFESEGRTAKQGLASADDFRFVRVWWEIDAEGGEWKSLAKGGSYSPFYSGIPAVINWRHCGAEVKAFEGAYIRNEEYYGLPGLTWPLRGVIFSAQAVPENCIFSVAGKMAFAPTLELDALAAIFNSSVFDYLICLFAGKVGGVQYEVGLIKDIPVPSMGEESRNLLSSLAKEGWSVARTIESTNEIDHAFLLPTSLATKSNGTNRSNLSQLLVDIQKKVDECAFELYGFDQQVRARILEARHALNADIGSDSDLNDIDADKQDSNDELQLLSWSIGVAFGRLDLRLATGEREAPPEPRPFDPLPAKSPGMLPDGNDPFHHHIGILVDDPGHPHDLPHLIESVLERVDMQVPDNVRRWLQRDFFKEHLKQYSKSRRKAPIYWPLTTVSGSYTLWVYYPELDDQTLYTASNDFLEQKLKLVSDELNSLRSKTNRNAAEERELEKQQDLEQELIELRDTILAIAPNYKPNHDDGVQITAAPLWPLFRHKPWQKVLKETWEKLEAGDYDWSHLAYSYWPDRVREKCKTDKSLAIAHSLEGLHGAT
ncbi:BREX-1 system adenine-specific DNA-methyltransferase PglX [Gammaproteobacteria bacterium]|nr:BREX-1 system adenine-specific DNA-methyltransferase PglX [Gammaproteobacteria bacterium]